jgi:pilus assembly protein CpaC
MTTRMSKVLTLVLVSVFSITTLCQAQGNVQSPPLPGEATNMAPVLADKKLIYPSDLKSILIKETEEKLFLDRSKAVVVRFPEPFMRAAIGDPNIADIVVISEQEIVLAAKVHGNTNLIVWYDTGVYNNYDVIVGMDFSKLESVINNVIQGNGEVSVFDANSAVVIKGHVNNGATFEKVAMIAESYIATLPGSSIVNLVTVEQTEQILLEVRFLEISHTRAEEQGVDLNFLTSNVSGYSWLGQTGAGPDEDQSKTIKNGRVSADMLEAGSSNGQYQATYQTGAFAGSMAMENLITNGIMKVIANPDLITKNKEEASFLAGGEFPVVTVNQEETNVEYKDYGVQLTFLPEITERSTIKLKVKPVVSLLDFTKGAVTVNGVLIPALITRRTETTVEMEDGKTLVISGLHSQSENTVDSKSPLLGNLPILGRFFSTTNFAGDELELIVVVTPHIVTAFDMGQHKQLFEADKVRKIINLSHMDVPEEQTNEMKRLLAQDDIAREEEAKGLMEEVVTRKYQDDLDTADLKNAELGKVVALEMETIQEKRDERRKEREVRIQAANDIKAQKQREKDMARIAAEDAEQQKENTKIAQKDAERQLQESKKSETERFKQAQKDEKRRAKEQLKIEKAAEKERARKLKDLGKKQKKQEEMFKRVEVNKPEPIAEKKAPVVTTEIVPPTVTNEKATRLNELDIQIEAKRQSALALYKEKKFEEGKALLDEMFILKQEREKSAIAQ